MKDNISIITTEQLLQFYSDRARVDFAFRYLEWYRLMSLPLPIPQTENVWQSEMPCQADLVLHSALDTIDDYLMGITNAKQAREDKPKA